MRRYATTFSALAGLIACVTAGGCGHPNPWDFAKDYVGTRPVALGYLAFPEAPGLVNADVQREAILEMSHRWWGTRPAPVLGYSLIAEAGGEAPTARSAALRALARAGDEAVVHVDRIVRALNARPVHVRWDAALALDSVVDDEAVDGAADNGLLAHVKWDRVKRRGERSPDVRAACARALRHYRRTDVVAALADVLENDHDLLVCWHAHDSLVELVGVDRGWTQSDWRGDAEKLPPLPEPGKRWWEYVLGLFDSDGGDDSDANAN